jgi:hypothetical protein
MTCCDEGVLGAEGECRGKRDLLKRQKRPTTKEAKETYAYWERRESVSTFAFGK